MTPVVLHHGLFGTGVSVGRLRIPPFRGINQAIAAAGYPVFISSVHPSASIEQRANQLKLWLTQNTPVSSRNRLILIGHSMGGLDARFMISKLDMADQIAALLTISTPHRGSPYADWILHHLGHRLRGIELVQKIGWNLAALPDLTTESCERFNEEIKDSPAVRYFSVSASRPRTEMPAFAKYSHTIIQKSQGPNDGLVSVQSAQWGTHLQTWQADHWQTINRQLPWRKRRAIPDIAKRYVSLIEIIKKEIDAKI